MELLGKIRRMQVRDKLSERAIAKRTGLSRNTVHKWLETPEEVEAPKYVRAKKFGKLAAFTVELEQSLKADAHRHKQDQRTGKALFAQIRGSGYLGGYSRVTDFIREWCATEGKKPHAFVPLKFELGEAFQFDWSEEGLVIGGICRHMQVSHMKLCASRAFWLVAYPSQGHEMLFDAHTRSFAALGGVARRGIYDNMKTAVDKVKKGKGRVVNARFAVMCAHYLEAQTRQWHSFDQLNAWLGERCRALWSEICHPEYKNFSVLEMLEQERLEMMPMPMPTPFDGYVESQAKVTSTCLVSVQRNRYSVPCELAGQRVSTRLYPTRISVVAHDAVVANHERLSDRGHTSYDWQHYIDLVQRKPGALRNGTPFADMPEPLKKLKLGLMRHDGGDKVMAQVLAAVPSAGLEAVLVAVELVVESGALSTEHVLNVLARLNAKPIPEVVETTLQLQVAPVANTGRYDSLRAVAEVSHAC